MSNFIEAFNQIGFYAALHVVRKINVNNSPMKKSANDNMKNIQEEEACAKEEETANIKPAINKINDTKDKIEGQEEVFLRIYDLSNGAAKVFSETLLGVKIDGVWHTSIEIFGNEYYFQNGLVFQPAGATHYGQHIDRISLGVTTCSKEELHVFFESSRNTWTPESYDLFENNCNNFSNYLSGFLVEKGIPPHILELPGQVRKFFQ